MRIRILHETSYRYGMAAKSAIQLLRLTPRNHDGQFVRDWRIDIDRPGRLIRREDCFGNITHALFLDGPLEAITITVAGTVECEDLNGMVRDTLERFPPAFYLRGTRLTEPDPAISLLASEAGAVSPGSLEQAHALMQAIHARMVFDVKATNTVTTAAEAWAAGHGVCQDLSQIFVSAAREIGIPARYVSGYLVQRGIAEQEASHAWAEAWIPDLGWVGFDPTNGICVTETHVRIAVGLDYLDAAPVRGSFYGGAEEDLSVRVRADETGQAQA